MRKRKKIKFDIPKGSLVMVVGIPNQEKTNLINKLKTDDSVVVSSQQIRDNTYTKKEDIETREQIVFKKFFEKIENNLKIRKTVLADSSLINPDIRKKLYILAYKYKRPIRVVFFNLPKDILSKLGLNVDKNKLDEQYEKAFGEYELIKEESNVLKKYNYNIKICNLIEDEKEKDFLDLSY